MAICYQTPRGRAPGVFKTYVRPDLRKEHASWHTCLGVYASQARHKSLTFEYSAGNTKRACDCCVNHRRLCVRMIEHAGECKLCYYPPPEKLRVSGCWDNLGYWKTEIDGV
jgi:hypothetical protein